MTTKRYSLAHPGLLSLLTALFLAGCGAPDEPTIALYAAVERGNIDQLERHIHWKTDVDAPLPNGRFPLHETARLGRVVMLRMLLEQGVQLEPRDADGWTPLQLALLNGRTQAAEVLIEAKAAFDPSELLLMVARENVSDRSVVRFLEQAGADMDVRDEQGNTPLLIAAGHGNHRLIHHLLQYGADVNASNAAGETALQRIRQQNLPKVERLLLSNGARG